MYFKIIILLIVLVVFPHGTLYAKSVCENPIAYIQGIKGGRFSDSILTHKGKKLPPALYGCIELGDTLESNIERELSIELNMCSKQKTISFTKRRPHVFKKNCSEKVKVISEWFSSGIAESLAYAYDAKFSEKGTFSSGTRNSVSEKSIIFPMMQSYESYITPGTKKLHLAWFGGVPPFTLSLLDSDNNLKEKISNVKNWTSIFSSRRFVENSKYKVLIQDASKLKIERNFSVSALPQKDDLDYQLNKLPDEEKALVTAIWLHDLTADRKWSLEAYNRLIGRVDSPARLVINAILKDEELNILW